jgi:hypothetical protein
MGLVTLESEKNVNDNNYSSSLIVVNNVYTPDPIGGSEED